MDPIFQSEVPVYFGSLMQIIDDFDEVLQPNMRAVIFKVLATVFNIYEEPDDRIKNVKRLYKWCVQQRLFSFTQGVQDQWNDFIDAIGQLYIVQVLLHQGSVTNQQRYSLCVLLLDEQRCHFREHYRCFVCHK